MLFFQFPQLPVRQLYLSYLLKHLLPTKNQAGNLLFYLLSSHGFLCCLIHSDLFSRIPTAAPADIQERIKIQAGSFAQCQLSQSLGHAATYSSVRNKACLSTASSWMSFLPAPRSVPAHQQECLLALLENKCSTWWTVFIYHWFPSVGYSWAFCTQVPKLLVNGCSHPDRRRNTYKYWQLCPECKWKEDQTHFSCSFTTSNTPSILHSCISKFGENEAPPGHDTKEWWRGEGKAFCKCCWGLTASLLHTHSAGRQILAPWTKLS